MTANRRLALAGAIALAGLALALALPQRAPADPAARGEVNWTHGYLKVSAIGLPPFGVANGPHSPLTARENGVALAQKRLLATLLELDVHGHRLRDRLASHPEARKRLRSLVLTAGVQGQSFQDGSVEITLTLATEGPSGLKAFLATL